MHNPNELSVTLNPAHRLLRTTLFLMAVVVGSMQLWEAQQAHDTPRLILGLCLILICIFGLLQIWRFRLNLTEGYIESQSAFGTKRVLWTDITQVKERKRHLTIYGSTDSVRVPIDVNRSSEVAGKIAEKLNALPVLQVHHVSAHWGFADRDEEGRLIHR